MLKWTGDDTHGEGGQPVMAGGIKLELPENIPASYIKLLEEKLTEYATENERLRNELKTIKHNQELTLKWARGEIEN